VGVLLRAVLDGGARPRHFLQAASVEREAVGRAEADDVGLAVVEEVARRAADGGESVEVEAVAQKPHTVGAAVGYRQLGRHAACARRHGNGHGVGELPVVGHAVRVGHLADNHAIVAHGPQSIGGEKE